MSKTNSQAPTQLDLPERPSPDFPARAEPKKRRRGPWFGVLIVLGVLLAIPILGGIGALLYVKLGYLDQTVQDALEKSLGEGARVESLHAEHADAYRAESLRVPSRFDPEQPAITADRIGVEVSLPSLLFDRRIRRVQVEKPAIRLRRNDKGQWNWSLPPREAPSGYAVEQIVAKDGSVHVEFAPGKAVRLEKAEITYSQPDPPLPRPVTVKAELPSGNAIQGSVLVGPGPELRVGLDTKVDLGRDLPGLIPPAWEAGGRIALQADARREAGRSGVDPASAPPGKSSLDGVLFLDSLRAKLAPELTLAIPYRRIDFRARLAAPAGLAELPAVEELSLDIEGIGRVSARADALNLLDKDRRLRVAGGEAHVDLDAVRGLFVPRLLGERLVTKGEVHLTGAEARVPLDGAWERLEAKGALRCDALTVAFPGLGDLPPLRMNAQWHASAERIKIETATLELGDVGAITLSAEVPVQENGPDLRETLKTARLEEVALDLNRLLGTEIGRRLAGQQLDLSRPAPPREELPVDVSGEISGRGLTFKAQDEGSGRTRLRLDGIEMRGVRILRVPGPLRLSDVALNGQIGVEALFEGGRLMLADLFGEVSTQGDTPIGAKLALAAEPGDDGKLSVRRVRLDRLSVPMAELARLLHYEFLAQLAFAGGLTATQGSYDLESGKVDGAVELTEVGFEAPLSNALRRLMGRAKVSLENGRLSASGQLDGGELSVLGYPRSLSTTGFDLRMDLPKAGGLVSFELDLNWPDRHVFKLAATVDRTQSERWPFRGSVDTSLLGGQKFDFSAVLVPAEQVLTQVKLDAKALDLAVMQKEILKSLAPDTLQLGGFLKDAEVSFERIPLNRLHDLNRLAEGPLQGRLKGTLAGMSFMHQYTDTEAEDLSGPLTLTFHVDERGTASVNAGATLQGFQALVGSPVLKALYGDVIHDLLSGKLYVPRLAGRACHAQLNLRFTRDQGWRRARVDKLGFDVPGLAGIVLDGTVQVPEGGDLIYKGSGVLNQALTVYDLAALHREIGVANLRLRQPRLAAMRISGGCAYTAKNSWDADFGAILAKLSLSGVDLEAGGERPITIEGLKGTLPLSFYRGLWPADWAREQKGTLTLERAALPPFEMKLQPLGVIARPNAVALANEAVLEVPGGRIRIENLRLADFFAREPAVRFDAGVEGISLDRLAQAEGWRINGLGESVLKGKLSNAALVRTSGPLGSWTFRADGELAAPFYQGTLSVGGFHARGLFGTSPVWGAWLKVRDMSMLQLTGQNQQLGRLKSIADLSIAEFTSAGLGLDDVQSFVFDLVTDYRPGVEDQYDGQLALLVARPMVEKLMREHNLGEQWIKEQRFDIERMGFRFVLSAGRLRGPIPLLDGGLIVKGRGVRSPDVPGSPHAEMSWRDAVRTLREHMNRF